MMGVRRAEAVRTGTRRWDQWGGGIWERELTFLIHKAEAYILKHLTQLNP